MAIVVSHHLSRVREEWSVGRPTKAQRMMQGGLRIARPMPMGSIVGSQMPGTAPHPFSGSPPETIPLDPPPLAQVLAQVRFSATPSIAIDEFFAPVQRALSPEYPIARKDQEIQFVINSAAEPVPTSSHLWRLIDDENIWRVTVSTMFLSLETTAYPGNEEFFRRFALLLALVGEHLQPGRVERLGIRYISRLEDDGDVARIEEFVRPEICGVASIDDAGIRAAHTLTQALFVLDTAQLAARWGILPPGMTTDPALMPSDRTSWLLDVDVFDEQPRAFDAGALSQTAYEYSRRQYQFFRWAVEPEFLLRFGADKKLVAASTKEPR